MCVFVAPKENYFTFIRYLCACGANWHSRATVRACARVRVKKTCITAAVRQLLFRVKTERNLKLLKKLLVERKATLHSKCISRTRHADAHVSAVRAQCSLNCKYGQNCARMRLCCPFYSVTKRLLFTDSKIKYFNCS